MDVLGHVLVQYLERPRVGAISASAGDLVVLDAAELVVLLPEIGFEELRRGEELKDCDVSFGELSPARAAGVSINKRPAPRVKAPAAAPLVMKARRLIRCSDSSFISVISFRAGLPTGGGRDSGFRHAPATVLTAERRTRDP
jgi:hypothetical protein